MNRREILGNPNAGYSCKGRFKAGRSGGIPVTRTGTESEFRRFGGIDGIPVTGTGIRWAGNERAVSAQHEGSILTLHTSPTVSVSGARAAASCISATHRQMNVSPVVVCDLDRADMRSPDPGQIVESRIT